jgi:hypothetical protein
MTTTQERLKKLTESTETANYIVCYNESKKEWELKGKMGNKIYFMKSCQFQTPLIAKQNELEAKKSNR